MTKTIFVRLAALAATVLIAPSAHALLIGETVRYDYFFPDLSTPYITPTNHVVGAGVEINGLFGTPDYATIDLSDNNILIDFTTDVGFTVGAFNGVRFSDALGTIAAITSVTLNAATNALGITASNITFDANNIYLNWQGLQFNSNTIISLDVNGGQSTTVPEPATLALFGLGALVAGAMRRRRAR